MRKSYRYLAAWLIAVMFSFAAYAQSVTVWGTVRNGSTKETVNAVSVVIKGTGQGTYTNSNGEFSLKITKLPVVLVFTSAGGYENQEVTVTDSKPVSIDLKVNNSMGQEVVVAATRTPQRILEAPVTVERLSSAVLRNVPSPSYYEALANLKGVDMHTASLTFRTITTRGFVSSGNTRLNQLIDGMDNQAPGLNFAVGNVVGLTSLDVDNIEVLSGASSALYGSGGMNGTVLETSKDPFKYTGFSFKIDQGIMHVDGKQHPAAPYNNWSFRWDKSYHDKIAVKMALELVRGSDWEADDYRDKQQIGILSKVVGGNRNNDPNFNGINVYGDETSADMNGFSYYVQDQTRRSLLAATGGAFDVVSAANAYFTSIGNPAYPTNAQISTFVSSLAFLGSTGQAAVQSMLPFYIGLKNNYYHNAAVSRTGYNEKDLVDYNTLNVKGTFGLHWKINSRIEASFDTYFGTGTTVYTGADRYSLKNLRIGQHKVEVKGKTWFVRAYTTQENAGDSYNATALGAYINEAYSPSSTWFPTYIATYSETRRQQGASGVPGAIQSDAQLHALARAAVDANRYMPGTKSFDSISSIIKATPIRKGGARFLDRSDLYAGEFQLNFSDALHFSNVVEVLLGTSWKQWVMNSQGTIFADTLGNIRINEYGTYAQLKKKFLHDVLTLTASGRYDKQTNFQGKFTPRVTAVIKVAKDNNIRFSYQSAYRFPTNQNQYISLVTGSGVLMGCLPQFQTFYKLNSTLPGFTAASVLAYRAATLADSSKLVRATYSPVKPETVNSFEIGYRGVISKKLLVDAYIYYSRYKNFLDNSAVAQSKAGNQYELYNAFTSTNVSYVQNSTAVVKSDGWGIGLEYQLPHHYVMYGNVFSDELRDVPATEVTFFNAPKYRFNIGLRNENVCHNVGFNVVVKWQDNDYYEGTFVTGTLPYYTTVDAQVTYHLPNTKSLFRVGGTNLGNSYYRSGFGSPAVGGLYYISYGYNLK